MESQMDNREFLFREVEILKQIPKDEVWEFIERNGERLRSLIQDWEWHSNLEIIEALTEWHKTIGNDYQ